MATKKAKKEQIETDSNNELLIDERSLIIKKASIKDGFCLYTYEPLKGLGKGDNHSVTGASLIHEDMSEAMEKLKVHLAIIDDAFKPARVKKKESTIEEFEAEETVGLYHVTGFEIKGKTDDEKVIIIGSKHVTIGGRIEIKTPSVHLTDSQRYKFYNELRVTLDEIRQEVEEYMNGKCTPVEDEDEIPGQVKLQFDQPAEGGAAGDVSDNELSGAKV